MLIPSVYRVFRTLPPEPRLPSAIFWLLFAQINAVAPFNSASSICCCVYRQRALGPPPIWSTSRAPTRWPVSESLKSTTAPRTRCRASQCPLRSTGTHTHHTTPSFDLQLHFFSMGSFLMWASGSTPTSLIIPLKLKYAFTFTF